MNSNIITFKKYMHNWLYSEDGYYSNYKQIGKKGDFYTAVSTSSFFGGAIAKKIVDEIKKGNLKENSTILEIGAHHGYLLADIIQFIYTLNPTLLKTLNFAIVERFENLQKEQKNYLEQSFANAINLSFYNDISKIKLDNAFIVANEIFDAFACELVYTKNEHLFQGFVKNEKIIFQECKDENIIKHCKKYNIQKGEICLDYESFIQTLCSNIKNFHFLTFDYGQQFYRNDFSIRVYFKHNVLPLFDSKMNLNTYFKKADITYDVPFNFLKDCFEKNSIKSVKFDTQMNSLVNFGIIELLEILKNNSNKNTYLKELIKIKTLLEPSAMGDRFKTLYVIK